jgi:hypothetical protein
MIPSIDVLDIAGDVARVVADETHGHRAHILDGDEPPLRRSRASLVDQCVEMVDA